MPVIDPAIFNWVVMPLLVFIARVTDVSMGTIRIMLLTRGQKSIAVILGFVEVLIWLLAVRQIILNLTNIACYFAFAAGFATGNYVGMVLEEKLAVGFQVVRTITKMDAGDLIAFLKSKGYGVTILDAQGTTGRVNVIFTIVKRVEIPDVIEVIKRFNPKAFYTIEDVKSVSEGVFPLIKKDLASRFKLFLR